MPTEFAAQLAHTVCYAIGDSGGVDVQVDLIFSRYECLVSFRGRGEYGSVHTNIDLRIRPTFSTIVFFFFLFCLTIRNVLWSG